MPVPRELLSVETRARLEALVEELRRCRRGDVEDVAADLQVALTDAWREGRLPELDKVLSSEWLEDFVESAVRRRSRRASRLGLLRDVDGVGPGVTGHSVLTLSPEILEARRTALSAIFRTLRPPPTSEQREAVERRHRPQTWAAIAAETGWGYQKARDAYGRATSRVGRLLRSLQRARSATHVWRRHPPAGKRENPMKGAADPTQVAGP